MSSELNEKVVHLAQVSGIAMGVEEGEPGEWMFPEGSDYLVAGLGVEQVDVDVLVSGETGEHHGAVVVPVDVVSGGLWREEGKFSRHSARHIPH